MLSKENKYWQQKWQSNEIGFNQQQPNELLKRYLSQLNLKPGNRIFVPLCGKSVDMLWLVEQGYEVIGVELSLMACEAFFAENEILANVTKNGYFTVFQSKKITLLCGDFFELNKAMLSKIDAVYDRAALIALPSELRQRYVQHLMRLFENDVFIFLITTAYNQNQMYGPPFSVDENEVQVLYGDCFSIKQLYNKAIKMIPAHLQVKGLTQAFEQVYFLSFI